MGVSPHCYSAGFPFSEDVRFGRQLARVADAPHDFVPVSAQRLVEDVRRLIIESDGLHSAQHMIIGAPLPEYLQSMAGAVLLEGYLFGLLGGSGLPAENDLPIRCAPHECAWALKHAHAGAPPELIHQLLKPGVAERHQLRWQTQIDDRYHHAPGDTAIKRAEHTYVNGRCGRIDVLGTGFLRRHVTVRSPGTERILLDWCARTPGAWRRGKAIYLEVLRRRYPRFARVSRTHTDGLPVAANTLLREWCWQREKVHRLWSRWRWAEARRWGTGSQAAHALLLQAWRRQGGLDQLLEADARVLAWISRDQLQTLWQQASHNPCRCGPLLSLGTIETMIRHLEEMGTQRLDVSPDSIPWKSPAPKAAISEGRLTCASC
jgi:hypothetical protein